MLFSPFCVCFLVFLLGFIVNNVNIDGSSVDSSDINGFNMDSNGESNDNEKILTGSSKPHLVIILADDYGWANVGYHRKSDDPALVNGEIRTPNLDYYANKYIKLERFYAYKICSPSRCSLQSGRLPVHVNFENFEPESLNKNDPISGFAGIPRAMTGIATKLKGLGYKTHATGKWDVGMATDDHTPTGRGYDSFLGYFHHANDYWTQGLGLTSIGQINVCLNRFSDLWDTNKPAKRIQGTAYEEELFLQNTLSKIAEHNPKDPFFLFHSFHLVHTPLQVPDAWMSPFLKIENSGRRLYSSMVWYMDSAFGSIVSMLEAKGMWDNTLLIFISDNGGPIYNPASANNHPLRGGKFSDFEGGIRVNSFLAGGAIPEKMRGKTINSYMHISDIYTTFLGAANAKSGYEKDELAEKYNLPGVDGVNHWPLLSGQTTDAKRNEIHISANCLIQGKYKLLTGIQPQSMWTGPVYPNNTGIQPGVPGDADRGKPIGNSFDYDCGSKGCLFNIIDDPTEHEDIVTKEPEIAEKMLARLNELNKTIFNPDRGEPTIAACAQAVLNGGFYGPFVKLPGLDKNNDNLDKYSSLQALRANDAITVETK